MGIIGMVLVKEAAKYSQRSSLLKSIEAPSYERQFTDLPSSHRELKRENHKVDYQ